MFLRRISVIICCLISIFYGHSQQIGVETARKAAANFLTRQQHTSLQKNARNLQLAYTANSKSTQKSGDSIPCYYVFNADNGGFVIIAASENIVPILAYSNEGMFRKSDMPCNMEQMLSAMQNEIYDAIVRNITAAPKVRNQWENLKLQSDNDYNKQIDAVEPLTLNILWDQWPYFNDSCPYDSQVSSYNGKRCPAGCTATAMATVIRYWKYPVHGYGSHSYTHNVYGTQYANFGNTYYQYDNMPEYLPAIPRSAQRKAISQLTYHCGVAVNMNYSATGSGAYVYANWNANANDALNAFKNYFGYSKTTGVQKKYYSDSQWKQLLKEQLSKSQPLIFSGYGEKGAAGHAFVCDGYDENDLFHFNWGWSGKYNCYCTVDSLCPGGVGTGGGNGNYSRDQSALIDINPYSEQVLLGWKNADAYCICDASKTQNVWLHPDTSMRIYSAEGSEAVHIHSIGTTFNPSAPVFGALNNRKLFVYPYRLDSLRIRYQYHFGSRRQANDKADTLKIYVSYHEIGDSSYKIINLNQNDYLCPITENRPGKPATDNCICINYTLSAADTAFNNLSIPINYQQITALGYDVPENAILHVSLQFAPGYSYTNGDTLCYMEENNFTCFHNAFALTCIGSNDASTFAGGIYNAALWENSEENQEGGYTPSLNLMPKWDYHLQYNTHPTSAYTEIDTQICGATIVWNNLHISKDGDYMQRFEAADGKDSIVVMHITFEEGIGEIGEILGANSIDSLGSYEFYVDSVEKAVLYQWELNSPKWQLTSNSNHCTITVNEKSSGTLKVTALAPKGICRRSKQIHLAYCDPMGELSEIHGLEQITRDGVYFYYTDSVEKATGYTWRVFHDGWSIQGDSTKTSVLVQICNGGEDSLYLIVSDECGYTATQSFLIRSTTGIAINGQQKSNISLYPNPTHDKLHIRMQKEVPFEAILSDTYGRRLQSQKTEGNCEFDLTGYAAGIYFIKISVEESGDTIYKVIKN